MHRRVFLYIAFYGELLYNMKLEKKGGVNMERTKVILFGCGNTGKLIEKYVSEHGGTLVAAVDHNAALVGTMLGNTRVTADVDESVIRDADIAVISTGGGLASVAPIAKRVLRCGTNVITSSEESIFPYSTSPELTRELDRIAKENGCTMTASGFQDVFWLHSVTAFAYSCSRIDRIKGLLRYNVEEYGASLAEDHGVGLTLKEFHQRFCDEFIPSYLWNVNELIAEKLGWGVAKQTQECIPYVYYDPLYSMACGKTIEKGRCVGMSAIVTTETKFGGIIETECIGKMYVDSDKDLCTWTFTGEPNLSFEVKSPKTLEHTAATLVNRIPQVINAASGYQTIDRLGPAEYLTFPMFLYK